MKKINNFEFILIIFVLIIIFLIGWYIGKERYSFNNIRNFSTEKITKETLENSLSICDNEGPVLEKLGYKNSPNDTYQTIKDNCISSINYLLKSKQSDCENSIYTSKDKDYYDKNIAICLYYSMEGVNIGLHSSVNKYLEDNN